MLDLQVWVQHHPAPAAGSGAPTVVSSQQGPWVDAPAAGSGAPAVVSSQQGQRVEAAPLPAVAGDPAAVTSRVQMGENPAGSGAPSRGV